jgi:hypothetical protein
MSENKDVFADGQWWLAELDQMVANGTPDQKRAVAVVRNLMRQHNAAPALVALGEPVAWWIPKAEQFCIAKQDGSRPFAKAWEPLYAAPAPVAQAWDEGYQAGINDERTSEANIGIAGFGAKVQPGRTNPYAAAPAPVAQPSPTAGMNIAQRILHVGGRNNAAGYVEFGSIQAVEALVRQVMRDAGAAPFPMPQSDAAPAPVAKGEVVRPYGACSIAGPKDDVAFILRHLPDVDDDIVLTQLSDRAINAIISQHEVYQYHPGDLLEFSRAIIKAATGQKGDAA